MVDLRHMLHMIEKYLFLLTLSLLNSLWASQVYMYIKSNKITLDWTPLDTSARAEISLHIIHKLSPGGCLDPD